MRTCLVMSLWQGRVDEALRDSEIDSDLCLDFDDVKVSKRVVCALAQRIPSVGFGLAGNASSLNAAGVGSCFLATEGTGMTVPATELNARR